MKSYVQYHCKTYQQVSPKERREGVQSHHSHVGGTVLEDAELDENNGVLGHRAQRSDEPGEVGEDILALEGVEEDLWRVSTVITGPIDVCSRCRTKLTPAP
jgi:hypothetical protein